MPTFDAVTTGGSGINASSSTTSHTVGAGSSRLLLVWFGTNTNKTVSSMTYGGVALTKHGHTDAVSDFGGSSSRRIELWYLKNPASGTADVVATLSGSGAHNIVATSFTGADQATTFRTGVKGGSSTAQASTSADTTGGAASDSVVSGLFTYDFFTVDPGGSQTEIADADPFATGRHLNVSTQPGGTGTITSSWSWTGGTTIPVTYQVALIAGPTSVAVGQAAETDTAQSITPTAPGTTVTVGQAAETDTAQPAAPAASVTIGQATETDTAQPVTPEAVAAVGQAAETDTAQPVTVLMQLPTSSWVGDDEDQWSIPLEWSCVVELEPPEDIEDPP